LASLELDSGMSISTNTTSPPKSIQ
jgi:hypothetical protein